MRGCGMGDEAGVGGREGGAVRHEGVWSGRGGCGGDGGGGR